ncbi:MAG: DUF3604 domain-containing protein [bacterium]|nr:DUF3604 domain-containing protein [bacterium]
MRRVALLLGVALGAALLIVFALGLFALSFVGDETDRASMLAILADPGDSAPPSFVPAESGERPYAITEAREPCDDYRPERRPLFGDLHVHTARSQDASTQDTRTSPADAYRFARGEAIGIQPYTDDGRPMRRVQLERPLDFAGVTDHAEQIGEVHICNTPGFEGYDSIPCRVYRAAPRVAFFWFNGTYSMGGTRWAFCGEDNVDCLAAAEVVWSEHRAAAEQAYDRSSSCAFTSLVAYEWTAAPKAAHLHRNVIFRNEFVPRVPVSTIETGPFAIELWRWLDEACRDGIPGCQAITIPHNTNWSGGTAFRSGIEIEREITAEEAPIRARYERLVEMMQHKGESECALFPGVTDEGCGFEKAANHMGAIAPIPMDYTRTALAHGLELEAELGVNPLAFGQIGSTDTHLGTPGLVAERGHPGHGGAGLPGNEVFDTPGPPDVLALNPGGLAVAWAEENTRDAVFSAFDRRETYATSGTRPTLRLFGGWDFQADLCEAPNLAAKGYARGVPMGSDLPTPPPGADAPRFLVAADRDAHESGADLDRIEIVKGWVADGATFETVLTVVGGDGDASVDTATCARTGSGRASLCTVWTDPDFDPDVRAFYYARLREVPSCRWTQWACVDARVDCDAGTVPAGYAYCCTDEVPQTIQERAWSSPIWYTPAAATADVALR